MLSETKLGWKRSSVNCVYTKEISVILNKHNHVRRGMYKHTKHVQTRVTEAFKLYKRTHIFFNENGLRTLGIIIKLITNK